MRVLLVTAYFRPHVGGVERFVELLADGLSACGHTVTVLCCRTDPDVPLTEQGGPYAVHRVPATNAIERRLGVPYPVPEPFALRRALAALLPSADVVHVQDALYATSQVVIRAGVRRRRPVLVTQHVGFVRQRHVLLDWIERLAIRAAGTAMRRADRVVSLNPAVAAWAERVWGLPSVSVLPVGVSMPETPPVRVELGLPEDRFLALFVGRDVPKKGLRFFVDAVDPAYELVAVTDASIEPRPGLHVRPFMPRDELARLMRSVDAFVLPSSDEGVPLVLQEASVAGVPIVTTAQPGFDYFFSTGDVLLIERSAGSIRDALLRLVADPALRSTLAERAASAGRRHFGLDAFVSAYEQAYAELVSRASAGHRSRRR